MTKKYYKGKNGKIYTDGDVKEAISMIFNIIKTDEDDIDNLIELGIIKGIEKKSVKPSIALFLKYNERIKAVKLYKEKYKVDLKTAYNDIKDMEENTSMDDFMRRSIPSVKNDMGEIRKTIPGSIVFKNGYVASIVAYDDNGFSVATCDYNGYFNWEILVPFGSREDGRFICYSEEELCTAVSIIERL